VVSKDNVLIVAIGTITVGFLGALISDVFSPISENVKDMISPPPNTSINTSRTFDNSNNSFSKNVNPGSTIPSRAIRFTFNSDGGPNSHFLYIEYHLLPSNISSVFECSFDGLPFEECISPKHYDNLQTEEEHVFKVRARGILGNADNSPATFRFTSVTSSGIEGKLINSSVVVDRARVWVDSKSAGLNTTTDGKGRFFFRAVGEGTHTLHISPNYTNYTSPRSSIGPNFTERFFVPPGAETVEPLSLDLTSLPLEILPPTKEINKTEQNKVNPSFKGEKNTQGKNYIVKIMQQSEPTNVSDRFHTKVWLNASESTLSKINNVTYYLHPTFTPNVVTIQTPENKFGLNFTNWGKFNLKAKVYFNDSSSSIKDLSLPPERWKVAE
jgi:hypothetical protein